MRDRWRKKQCAAPGCMTSATRGDWCGHHDPATYHRTYLTAVPLIELVEARGGPTACGADSGLRRAYCRAKAAGQLTEMQADALALRLLGVHPWEIWDSWFTPTYSQGECETVDA